MAQEKTEKPYHPHAEVSPHCKAHPGVLFTGMHEQVKATAIPVAAALGRARMHDREFGLEKFTREIQPSNNHGLAV